MKYKEIIHLIEKNIRTQVYSDRLPTLRALSAEFGVSSRTMHRALKSLFTRGLIVPDSTRGYIVSRGNNIRPKTGIAGIFCNIEEVDLKTDPLLKRLKEIILADGFTPFFSNVPDAKQFSDINFWKSFWVDGCIFAYSTFDRQLASGLKLAGIPFLAANRVPDEYGANWVDFDAFGAIHDVVVWLYKHGYRRIALDNPVHLVAYGEHIRARWTELLGKYGIFRPEYLKMTHCNFSERHKIIMSHGTDLAALPEPPEAVICWHGHPELVRDLLRPKSRNLQIFAYKTEYEIKQNGITYLPMPYDRLAEEVWKSFQAVVASPAGENIHRLVELDMSELKKLEGEFKNDRTRATNWPGEKASSFFQEKQIFES